MNISPLLFYCRNLYNLQLCKVAKEYSTEMRTIRETNNVRISCDTKGINNLKGIFMGKSKGRLIIFIALILILIVACTPQKT